MNERYKKIGISLLTLFLIAVLFLIAGYFSREYQTEIQNYIGSGYFGVIFFIVLNIISVVIAPFSTLPLIPVASGIWGWFLTGIYSVVAWTIGAQIAFTISRKFGKKLVYKIVSVEQMEKIESKIPENNTFWSLVLLRIIVPVDILSYAIGLFSNIKPGLFFATTLIGITPFAFIFSYAGILSTKIQIIIFVEILAVILLLVIYRKSNFKKTILFLIIISFLVTIFVYKAKIFEFICDFV